MDFFADFDEWDLSGTDTSNGQISIHGRSAGSGPPLALLHGHPRTHTTWNIVAPRLVAAGLTVVCPDLRGYGRSTAPPRRPDHAQASKRAMAADVAAVMSELGHDRFAVAGHDRGSYVAYRTPERLGEGNYADYDRAICDPETVQAMLEDYRAGLGVDREADEADRAAGRRISCPLLVAWSRHDDMQDLYGDVPAVWQPWTEQTPRTAVIDSGHHMAEEAPVQLADELETFLRGVGVLP